MSAVWATLVHGFNIGWPIGIALGIALGPARVSGVDFRQFFRDPAQPSEFLDDSWIGLVRGAANMLAGVIAAALLVAAAWTWFPRSCWPPDPDWSLLRLVADCAGFWLQWPIAIGITAGAAAVLFVVAQVWELSMIWLPNPDRRPSRLAAAPAPAAPYARERRAGHRRLIVCCDGTWNWPDGERETNVVRLLRAIKPMAADGTPQIAHYHIGVGTGNFVDRIVGGGAGVGLSNSVKACYGFLVDNYQDGDEIFLFGFSRGAYVARSVAGVIGTVGILRKPQMEHFINVWDWYTQPRDQRSKKVLDDLVRGRHSQVDIECIGVWDTVGALGIPGTRFCAKSFAFHETQLGDGVRHAFQALAIDERRGNFQAAIWVRHPTPRRGQMLAQVWFPGVHSNVGGGYPEHGLSDTAFLWMLSHILDPTRDRPDRDDVDPTRNLLDLDLAYVDAALDSSADERYPNAKLQNSRTLVWQLLGCSVPRPVAITSDIERIHASAWDRRNVPSAQDLYRQPRRLQWLIALKDREVERTLFEERHARHAGGSRAPAARPVSSKLGFCDRLMQFIGGSG
jgi:uncharacterized protein (DUF2235 family)